MSIKTITNFKIWPMLLLAAAAMLFGSCDTTQAYLINDPTVMLKYKQNPTHENLQNLANSYAFRINRLTREGRKPQSGLYAEYAVCMALLGHEEAANEWFSKEVGNNPCSDSCLRQVKYNLIRGQLTDADTLGFSFLPVVERPVDTLSKVLYDAGDDETNTQFASDQQLSKKDKERAKKEQAKMKQKAQKQKAKAKKKEQKTKAKAKKTAQKEKAKAKKAKAKAKDQAKKAKAAEKKALKKAKTDEQKALKKAKAEEQKAMKKAKAEEKSTQKKAKENEKKAIKKAKSEQ